MEEFTDHRWSNSMETVMKRGVRRVGKKEREEREVGGGKSLVAKTRSIGISREVVWFSCYTDGSSGLTRDDLDEWGQKKSGERGMVTSGKGENGVVEWWSPELQQYWRSAAAEKKEEACMCIFYFLFACVCVFLYGF